MNTPPPDVRYADLVDALRTGWGIGATSVEYAPVGFGSHHWIARDGKGGRWFVTVDDLAEIHLGETVDEALARLSTALATARRLCDGGLAFVVAPITDRDGAVVRRLQSGFSIAVFPFLEGEKPAWGEYRPDQIRNVRERFERLHAATALVAGVADREDFRLPGRAVLERAMQDTGHTWSGGPYSEKARAVLDRVRDGVRRALDEHDRLVDPVRGDPVPWVVTHGEPHAANTIWTADGPQLIDWDTVLIAPPARDLWMLEPRAPAADRPVANVLYRLRWDLKDFASYTVTFRGPHEATADTAKEWNGFEHCAGILEQWPRSRADG